VYSHPEPGLNIGYLAVIERIQGRFQGFGIVLFELVNIYRKLNPLRGKVLGQTRVGGFSEEMPV